MEKLQCVESQKRKDERGRENNEWETTTDALSIIEMWTVLCLYYFFRNNEDNILHILPMKMKREEREKRERE